MRVLSQAELQDVLQKHKRWLETRFNEATEGECGELKEKTAISAKEAGGGNE